MKTKKASFSLVFYISRTKIKKNGEVPVYLKINLDGAKTSFQIKRHILPELWDTNRGQMTGRSAEVKAFNAYLDAITVRAHNLYNQLLKVQDHVTVFQLRDAILGTKTAQPRQVIEIWEEYIANLMKLVGKETSETTVRKHKTCKNYFSEFLQKHYKVKDVSIKMVNYQMVNSFNLFLKTEKRIGFNTAIKFLQNFKRIIIVSMRNGWLTSDPFSGVKLTLKNVARPYLTEEELERVMAFNSPIDRLMKVRDFFLFSCFTGLAYSDVKKLKGKELVRSDEDYWIKTFRQKTGEIANIPLLPVPLSIINKYNPIEEIYDDDPVLPVPSNQKLNAYLKELADLTGISKTLSFHVARHTFATTVTLTNGVPIESVSKMLGHKDLKSTQHYARIVDQKVGADMAILHTKLENKMAFRI